VDDGSIDRTGEIIEDASRRFSWIEPVHAPVHHKRAPGGESIIKQILSSANLDGANFLFRVDADITLAPDHVEKLLAEFGRDPRLGIASGTLYEQDRTVWRAVIQPRFQPAGAARMYSKRCLDAIGGLEGGLGWDTIDVMRALMAGFTTRG